MITPTSTAIGANSSLIAIPSHNCYIRSFSSTSINEMVWHDWSWQLISWSKQLLQWVWFQCTIAKPNPSHQLAKIKFVISHQYCSSNKNTGPHHLMQPMSHANNFCIDEHELPNMVHLFHTTILKIPYLISGCQHDSMPLNEIKSWLASCVPIQPLVAILTFYMSFQQNNYSPIQWPMFLT
jgi:hypothetical protein